jgi:hypothetical protein
MKAFDVGDSKLSKERWSRLEHLRQTVQDQVDVPTLETWLSDPWPRGLYMNERTMASIVFNKTTMQVRFRGQSKYVVTRVEPKQLSVGGELHVPY